MKRFFAVVLALLLALNVGVAFASQASSLSFKDFYFFYVMGSTILGGEYPAELGEPASSRDGDYAILEYKLEEEAITMKFWVNKNTEIYKIELFLASESIDENIEVFTWTICGILHGCSAVYGMEEAASFLSAMNFGAKNTFKGTEMAGLSIFGWEMDLDGITFTAYP